MPSLTDAFWLLNYNTSFCRLSRTLECWIVASGLCTRFRVLCTTQYIQFGVSNHVTFHQFSHLIYGMVSTYSTLNDLFLWNHRSFSCTFKYNSWRHALRVMTTRIYFRKSYENINQFSACEALYFRFSYISWPQKTR